MFKHPFTMVLYSPSAGGKSHFVSQLLKNLHMVDKPFDILYYYQIYSDEFKEHENKVKFLSKDVDLEIEPARNTLIVCDDCMSNKTSMANVVKLATFGRHKSVSLILLVQDFFYSRILRTVTLNSNIFILFRNLRDKISANNLFRQLAWPDAFLEAIYKDACHAKPYSYLCISLQHHLEDHMRFSTDLFGERPKFYVQSDFIVPEEPIECRFPLRN
jgi:hypothetical protein